MKPVPLILLLLLAACGPAETPSDQADATGDNAVLFVHSEDIAPMETPWAWGLPAKTLRADPDTGAALDVSTPPGWSALQPLSYDRALEIMVLDGNLRLGEVALDALDFLRVPAGSAVPPPVAGSDGARFLMFFDDGLPRPLPLAKLPETVGTDWLQVGDRNVDWVAATAMQENGLEPIPVRLKHLRNDPKSGARTYLLEVGPELQIPWEVHGVSEETYFISGDFTLSECLPEGPRTETYGPGGYFYRPAGIAHMGPDSGTQAGALMLIRTPAPLTIELLEACRVDGSGARTADGTSTASE